MITHLLHTIGVLSLLATCTPPTHILAGENANPEDCYCITIKKALIIAGIVTIYFACSKDARSVATKATLLSSIACLRLLIKLPLSDAIQQKIKEKIDYLGTAYVTCVNNSIERHLYHQRPCFGINKEYIEFCSLLKHLSALISSITIRAQS